MSDDLARMLPPLDDGPGPSRRLPATRFRTMVDAIVERATTGEAQEPAPPRRAPRRIALLAAALVSGSIGVAAAAWIVTRDPAPASTPTPPAAPAPEPGAPRVPAVVETPEPPPEPLPDLELPAETAPPRTRRTPRRADDELPADAPVEDVLALANQRRKDKRWHDAAALYERVRAAHRGTDAAIVATIAAAALHLDHLADPGGARRRFAEALRLAPTGPLAEEARWGIVEASRALADVPGERAALEAFLAAHPGSANATAARRRLAELE